MSFRFRVFLLVTLISFLGIGATAALTLRLTSAEYTRVQETVNANIDEMVYALQQYGMRRGNWLGVSDLVQDYSERTGLHIRLATADGSEVVVDTDNLAGRAASPVSPFATPIDPRPQAMFSDYSADPFSTPEEKLTQFLRDRAIPEPERLFEPATEGAGPLASYPGYVMVRQLAQYRAATRALPCMVKPGGTGSVMDLDRAPYLSAAQVKEFPDCVLKAAEGVLTRTGAIQNDWLALDSCAKTETGGTDVTGLDSTYCLNTVFSERVAGASAVQLQLYLGAQEGDEISQLGRPALIGVAGLLLVALIGTALVARQVARPVRQLTDASQEIAGGRLDVRVPAGHRDDDLTRLSRSFNAMADAVQRSEERQRRLVADVAHELRTPLSNLRGYLEGLSDGVIPPTRELFASLHEETLLQGRILDDLQVLALAESGKLDYSMTDVDLADLARNAATAHAAVAAEAGLSISARAVTPAPLAADPERLRQVIGNLLTNAIRYTDPGGAVTLTVRTDERFAYLDVADTGSGIAPEDIPRVFDRFWRADPARQRATGGSGLGLTIAYRIVTDHGGGIGVRSRPGEGTTFTVTVPLSPYRHDPHRHEA